MHRTFFFSSRRRHTSFSRDWSSDVCSSDLEPVGDLLRAPRAGPAPVLTTPVTPPDPAHGRARHLAAVGGGDGAGKPVLHVLPQRVVRGELGGLGAPSTALGMPLRGRRPVLQAAAAGGRVPPELTRDR